MQFKNVLWQPGPCICGQNPYGKIKVKDMEEEEEEEDKKRKSTFAVGVLASDTGSRLSKNTLKLHN